MNEPPNDRPDLYTKENSRKNSPLKKSHKQSKSFTKYSNENVHKKYLKDFESKVENISNYYIESPARSDISNKTNTKVFACKNEELEIFKLRNEYLESENIKQLSKLEYLERSNKSNNSFSYQETVKKDKFISEYKIHIDSLEKDKIILKNKLLEIDNQKTNHMIKVQQENIELKRKLQGKDSVDFKHHTNLHEEKLNLVKEKKLFETKFRTKIEMYEEKICTLQKRIEELQARAIMNTSSDEEILRLSKIIKDLEQKLVNAEQGKINGSHTDYIKILQIENSRYREEVIKLTQEIEILGIKKDELQSNNYNMNLRLNNTDYQKGKQANVQDYQTKVFLLGAELMRKNQQLEKYAKLINNQNAKDESVVSNMYSNFSITSHNKTDRHTKLRKSQSPQKYYNDSPSINHDETINKRHLEMSELIKSYKQKLVERDNEIVSISDQLNAAINKSKNMKNQLTSENQKKDKIIAELRVQFENYRNMYENNTKEYRANSSNNKKNETKRSFHSRSFGKFSVGTPSLYSGMHDDLSIKKTNYRHEENLFDTDNKSHKTDKTKATNRFDRHEENLFETPNHNQRTDKKTKVICCFNPECGIKTDQRHDHFYKDSTKRDKSSNKHRHSREKSECNVCHKKLPMEKLSPATEMLLEDVKLGRTPSRGHFDDLEEKISFF